VHATHHTTLGGNEKTYVDYLPRFTVDSTDFLKLLMRLFELVCTLISPQITRSGGINRASTLCCRGIPALNHWMKINLCVCSTLHESGYINVFNNTRDVRHGMDLWSTWNHPSNEFSSIESVLSNSRVAMSLVLSHFVLILFCVIAVYTDLWAESLM